MPAAETEDAVHAGHAHDGSGKRKRIKTLASFASELQRRLPLECADSVEHALIGEIKDHVHSASRHGRTEAFGDSGLDQLGTDLWNLCTRMNRDISDGSGATSRRKVLLAARALAFVILDLAQWAETETKAAVAVHLTRLALKTSRDCISMSCSTLSRSTVDDETRWLNREGTDNSDLELALLTLQRAFDYTGHLHGISSSLPEDEGRECKRLETEYIALRTALAWRQDKFDVAEHMYGKIQPLRDALDPHEAQIVADVFFEIGKDLWSRHDVFMAAKWLDRAYSIFRNQSLDKLSSEGVELRLSIMQSLVTALLGLGTLEGFESAQNHINDIESKIGDHLVVLLLRLELLNKSPAEEFDVGGYAGILRRMIGRYGSSSHSPSSHLRLLVHHIRRLHDKSPGLACAVLDQLLLALRICDAEWMDKLVVTRMWMTIGQRDTTQLIEEAQGVLSKLQTPLCSEAAIAAQTLLWKKVDSNYSQGQPDLAGKWCRLALSDAFQKSGPLNRAKIERKLLLCSIAQDDMNAAREAFYAMPRATQQDPLTQYLLYKIAIRCDDRALASECLKSVSGCPTSRDNFIYACVIDSQHVGNRLCAVEALKRLADDWEYQTPDRIHLPALFRCTIQLLHGLIKNKDGSVDEDATIQDICGILELVVKALQKNPMDTHGDRLFNTDELDWFCRNAYNLGVKYTSTWKLDYVVRILTVCVNIIAKFPDDMPSPMARDLSLKGLFCNFLASSALTALARAEENRERQLEYYLVMRKHISSFQDELGSRLASLDENSAGDLLTKLSVLLVFDFEGAVVLEQWASLGEIIRRAEACKSVTTYQAIADCLLRSHAPDQELFVAMREIVNRLWDLEGFTSTKVAKYLRCLFQAVLPQNNEFAFHLMKESCEMARQAAEVGDPVPEEELEWIATTAFNEAIDWYGSGEEDRARQWAKAAMSLAHYCRDEGRLEDTMRRKYIVLKLED